MVLIRRPFSPNPFLPLHNFQRRFDFLGTQMHCFTEKHIRFGRSFTSQGANSLLLMDSEHRLSPARTDTPFNVPVPNGNRVEICLKLSHISAGIKRERQTLPPERRTAAGAAAYQRSHSESHGRAGSSSSGSACGDCAPHNSAWG